MRKPRDGNKSEGPHALWCMVLRVMVDGAVHYGGSHKEMAKIGKYGTKNHKKTAFNTGPFLQLKDNQWNECRKLAFSGMNVTVEAGPLRTAFAMQMGFGWRIYDKYLAPWGLGLRSVVQGSRFEGGLL